MDRVAYLIGVSVLSVFVPLLLWLVAETIVAFVASCSWHRWNLRIQKLNNRQPLWRHLPRSLVSKWFQLIGHRNTGSSVWYGTGGHWNGIGDWMAYKVPKVDPSVEQDEPDLSPENP